MVTAADPCTEPGTPRAAACILESISEAFVSVDANWHFTYINAQAEQIYRAPREQLLGRVIWEAFPTALGTVFEREYRRVMHDRTEGSVRAPFPRLGAWFEVKIYPLDNGGLAFYFSDITERRCAEKHVLCQKKALDLVIAGAPLNTVLATLAEAMESMSVQPLRASITVTERSGAQRHAAAPTLPESCRAAIDMAETAELTPFLDAASKKRAVPVPRLCDYPGVRFRNLAMAHGLQACWSAPILSSQEQVLGTFSLYYLEPALPSLREQEAAALMIQTAAVVIDRQRMLLQ